MKKNLLIALLLSCGILFSSVLVNATNQDTTNLSSTTSSAETTPSSTGMISVLMNAFGDLQSLESQLTEEEANLAFEKTFEFPSLVELEKNQKSIEKKKAEIVAIEEKSVKLDETVADTKDALTAVLQEQIDFANNPPEELPEVDIEKQILAFDAEVTQFQTQLDTYDSTQIEYDSEKKILGLEIENLIDQQPALEKTLADRQARQIDNIAQYEKNIGEVREQIARQKRLIKSRFTRAIISLTVFMGVILFLLLLRLLAAKIIKRFYVDITEKRKKALVKLSRVTFNVIIGIAVLTILFAQFASLLPFLLLLGTGFAFAVRDSISSFIGWFVIGTDQGFRLGDVIKIGDAYGQVKDIASLNTVLWEMQEGVRTGKVITVPNKNIFDHSLVNYSHSFRVNRIQIPFWLAPSSDVETVKIILHPLLMKVYKKFEKDINRMKGVSEADKHPLISFESHEKHIKVIVQIFVPIEERSAVQREVTEAFLKEVQKNKKVELGG